MPEISRRGCHSRLDICLGHQLFHVLLKFVNPRSDADRLKDYIREKGTTWSEAACRYLWSSLRRAHRDRLEGHITTFQSFNDRAISWEDKRSRGREMDWQSVWLALSNHGEANSVFTLMISEISIQKAKISCTLRTFDLWQFHAWSSLQVPAKYLQ